MDLKINKPTWWDIPNNVLLLEEKLGGGRTTLFTRKKG